MRLQDLVIKGVPYKVTLLVTRILFYKETMLQCELLWYDIFHSFFHIHNKPNRENSNNLNNYDIFLYSMSSVIKIVSKTFWEFVTILSKWHTITSFNWQIHVWPVVLQLECFGLGSLIYLIALTHIQIHNYLTLWMIRIIESWQQYFSITLWY